MKPEDILRAYEQLFAAQLSSELRPTDQSIVISDEDGVRVILTRTEESVELDIEISRPRLEIAETDDADEITKKCREAALRSIRHLEFLVYLADHGFSLSMEESEFLWIASIILTEPPSDSLSQLLQKPY
jgi:bifunctional DNA-binding transcriptional regulator/antitoxin component of YhaV-PrlF toxin-antitoxin module